MIDEFQPLVSVIIPVRNAEPFLKESIDSILGQTYQHLEVIVVDDGSTDSSLKIAEKYSDRIVVSACEAKGVWTARNHGVSISKGTYLAFHDADDIALPNRLALQMQLFQNNPITDIVFGNMIEFSGDPQTIFKNSLEELETIKVKANCPGAMTLTRKAFYQVGNFLETWKVAGFIDWYMQALDLQLKIETPPDIILARRIHDKNSTTVESSTLPKEYLNVIRNGLLRRKAPGGKIGI